MLAALSVFSLLPAVTMATQIIDKGPGIITVKREEKRFLGIDTKIPAGSFSLRKLASERRQPGLLVRNGLVEKWRALGFVEHGGSMFIYGDYLDVSRIEPLLDATAEEQLAFLTELAECYRALLQNDHEVPRFHTQTILQIDGGGILLLPPDIRRVVREHEGTAESMRHFEPFNHPDLSPAEGVSFSLAALAYRALTQTEPFVAPGEEELHSRIRGGQTIDANLRRFPLRPEIATALRETLVDGKRVDPAEWASRFRTWMESGFDREISEQQVAELRVAAEAAQRRTERVFARKESVRRNWRIALIIVVVAVVAGAIPATIIRNALQPRQTAGFAPEQVVTAFYSAIGRLDHSLMEDAVTDGAGSDYVREAINLFVISRQRMSVEMRSGFVDAQEWRDAGMPEPAEAEVPYGVANLSLQELEAPPGERAFEVTFERWFPQYRDSEPEMTPEEADTLGPQFAGAQVTERTWLRQDDEDWVIYRIEQVSSEPIDVEQLRESVRDEEAREQGE